MTSTADSRLPELRQKNRFMSSQIFMKLCQERYTLSYRRDFKILALFSRRVFAMECGERVQTSSNGIRSKTAFICVTVALRNTWHSIMLSRFLVTLAR